MRNEEKRAHGVRRAALALPCVRDELDPRQRLPPGTSILRRMVAVEGNPARYAGSGRTFRRKTSRFWGIWPSARGRRRDSSRGVRRRHLDRPRPGRSHRMLGAARPVLAPRPRRDDPRFGGRCSRIAPPDMVVTDGGFRVRLGSGEGVAGDEGSKMHFSTRFAR